VHVQSSETLSAWLLFQGLSGPAADSEVPVEPMHSVFSRQPVRRRLVQAAAVHRHRQTSVD
jgi:hypothetical protein